MDECAKARHRRRLPYKVRKGVNDFDPSADTIQVMTLHASKGLELPVVAVVSAKYIRTEAENNEIDPFEEMRLFYVGATRATLKLIVANAEKLSNPVGSS